MKQINHEQISEINNELLNTEYDGILFCFSKYAEHHFWSKMLKINFGQKSMYAD